MAPSSTCRTATATDPAQCLAPPTRRCTRSVGASLSEARVASLFPANSLPPNLTTATQRGPWHMAHHHLRSAAATCHWGFFDAALKPVLSVKSGDEVTIETISGGPQQLPDSKRFR